MPSIQLVLDANERVIGLGDGTVEAARQAQLAEASATAAALSEATAEAAAGPTYASTAAGLAATSSGESFAVDNGDGTVTVYLNSGGSAVSQRTLATTAYLASTAGGDAVGLTDGGTVQDHFDSDGGLLVGGVTLAPRSGDQTSYAVFRNNVPGASATRVYALPPETILGQTVGVNTVLASFTAFFDDYDAQLAESLVNSDWTGPHYRDGGVSTFVGTMSPDYAPAGLVAFNAKIGGNWWPFRPAAGLCVSEKPWATVFELQTSVALAGPTFAGGGVYPSDRWRPGKAYSVGDICHEYGRVYEVVTAGTSGQTPPLHDGVGGARADGWDVSILTTAGTLSGGYYRGTDGGGVVEYALIEQLYPMNTDNVLLLGPALDVNPLLALGDGVQLAAAMFVAPEGKIVGARRNANGSGTTGNAGLHVDTNGAMRFGYSTTKGLLARHNSTTDLKFDGVSYSLAEKSKASGDTTVDVSGVNIVKFSDGAATNFTGFTNAQQGQVIHLIFNNSNTTLVHSTGSLRIPGGANITPGSNDAYTVVMRSASTAQIIGSP